MKKSLIYSQPLYDYNKNAQITKNFYSKVQNKLHYAVSGMTVLEIIKNRASSEKEHMGLTSWNNSPDGKILLRDTKIAKNYLNDDELKTLRCIVNMYLDYAEDRVERHIPMSMKDWATTLDKFLEFNEYQILIQNLLKDIEFDTIVTDGYRAYPSIIEELGLKHQTCTFHKMKNLIDKLTPTWS